MLVSDRVYGRESRESGGSPVFKCSQRCQEFMEAPLAAEALMLLTVPRMISSFIGLHVVVSICVCARV